MINFLILNMSDQIIIVDGLIGAGKSTFVKSLFSYYKNKGYNVIQLEEPVDELMLEAYIKHMDKYAYKFQSYMLMERIAIYENAQNFISKSKCNIAIIDRGLYGDYAFALLQREACRMDDIQWKIYNDIVSIYIKKLSNNKIIFLNCDENVAMERIIKRNRPGEINGYSIDYLKNLNAAYKVSFEIHKAHPIIVDWNNNLVVKNGVISEKSVEDLLKQL